MGNIGDPISSGSIPAVGTAGTTYASELNLFLTEVKNRLEAEVPRASLAPGPLDLDGEALQNAEYSGLVDIGETPTTPNNSLQCYNGEVYWVNSYGAAKLTDSGGLNASGVGAITGDYGGLNPAQFRFVDADQEFYAYDDYGAGEYAYVWARAFDLAEHSTSTKRIRLAAPNPIVSSFTLTFPDKPASTKLVTMSSSGTLATFNGGVQTKLISTAEYDYASMGGANGLFLSAATGYISGGIAPRAVIPLTVCVGDVLSTLVVKVSKESDTGTTWTLSVRSGSATPAVSGWTDTTIVTTSANTAGSPGTPTIVTLTATINTTAAAGTLYYAIIESNDTTPSSTDLVAGAVLTYTQTLPGA